MFLYTHTHTFVFLFISWFAFLFSCTQTPAFYSCILVRIFISTHTFAHKIWPGTSLLVLALHTHTHKHIFYKDAPNYKFDIYAKCKFYFKNDKNNLNEIYKSKTIPNMKHSTKLPILPFRIFWQMPGIGVAKLACLHWEKKSPSHFLMLLLIPHPPTPTPRPRFFTVLDPQGVAHFALREFVVWLCVCGGKKSVGWVCTCGALCVCVCMWLVKQNSFGACVGGERDFFFAYVW